MDLQVGRDFKRVLVPGLRVIAGVGFSEMPHEPYQVSLRPGPHGLGKAQAAAATDLPLQGPGGWSAPSIRPFLVMWMRLRKTSAVSLQPLPPLGYSIHLVLHACVDTAEKVGGVLETLFLWQEWTTLLQRANPHPPGNLVGKQLTSLGRLSKLAEVAEGLKGLVGLEALLGHSSSYSCHIPPGLQDCIGLAYRTGLSQACVKAPPWPALPGAHYQL